MSNELLERTTNIGESYKFSLGSQTVILSNVAVIPYGANGASYAMTVSSIYESSISPFVTIGNNISDKLNTISFDAGSYDQIFVFGNQNVLNGFSAKQFDSTGIHGGILGAVQGTSTESGNTTIQVILADNVDLGTANSKGLIEIITSNDGSSASLNITDNYTRIANLITLSNSTFWSTIGETTVGNNFNQNITLDEIIDNQNLVNFIDENDLVNVEFRHNALALSGNNNNIALGTFILTNPSEKIYKSIPDDEYNSLISVISMSDFLGTSTNTFVSTWTGSSNNSYEINKGIVKDVTINTEDRTISTRFFDEVSSQSGNLIIYPLYDQTDIPQDPQNKYWGANLENIADLNDLGGGAGRLLANSIGILYNALQSDVLEFKSIVNSNIEVAFDNEFYGIESLELKNNGNNTANLELNIQSDANPNGTMVILGPIQFYQTRRRVQQVTFITDNFLAPYPSSPLQLEQVGSENLYVGLWGMYHSSQSTFANLGLVFSNNSNFNSNTTGRLYFDISNTSAVQKSDDRLGDSNVSMQPLHYGTGYQDVDFSQNSGSGPSLPTFPLDFRTQTYPYLSNLDVSLNYQNVTQIRFPNFDIVFGPRTSEPSVGNVSISNSTTDVGNLIVSNNGDLYRLHQRVTIEADPQIPNTYLVLASLSNYVSDDTPLANMRILRFNDILNKWTPIDLVDDEFGQKILNSMSSQSISNSVISIIPNFSDIGIGSLLNTGNNDLQNILAERQNNVFGPMGYMYMYSFALEPEEYQPSGTLNFSRIDSAIMQMQLNEANTSVEFFARNYNILRFMNGMAGIGYQA